jgi:hypothetical protein
LETIDPQTTTLKNLNKFGYKATYKQNKKILFLIIPKEHLTDRQIFIKEDKEDPITLTKRIKTKGKYSNYTNITVKTNTSLKDQLLTKKNTLTFDGLTNIDNLKLAYKVNNTKEKKRMHVDEANIIWEEFRHVNVSLGLKEINTRLNALNNNTLIGLTIESKQKKTKQNYTNQKITLSEKSRIKLLIKNEVISNLILEEGTTYLKNIPIKFGNHRPPNNHPQKLK